MHTEIVTYGKFVERIDEFKDCVFLYCNKKQLNKSQDSCIRVELKMREVQPLLSLDGLIFRKGYLKHEAFSHSISITNIEEIEITVYSDYQSSIIVKCMNKDSKKSESFFFDIIGKHGIISS